MNTHPDCWCCHIDPNRRTATMAVDQLCPKHLAMHEETRRERAEAFAKAEEGRPAPEPTRRTKLDGPPPDGHEHEWIYRRASTGQRWKPGDYIPPGSSPHIVGRWEDKTVNRRTARNSVIVGMISIAVLFGLIRLAVAFDPPDPCNDDPHDVCDQIYDDFGQRVP